MSYIGGQTYRSDLHHKLETALIQEARRRNKNPNWIETERQVMLKIVNEERRKRRRPLLTLEDIERVERTAEGHVDYAHKFALYCAELAEGD